MGYDVEYDDAEDYDCWVRSPDRSGVHGYGSSGTRASSSSPQAHSLYHGAVVSSRGSSPVMSDRPPQSFTGVVCF